MRCLILSLLRLLQQLFGPGCCALCLALQPFLKPLLLLHDGITVSHQILDGCLVSSTRVPQLSQQYSCLLSPELAISFRCRDDGPCLPD